jgi:hypothetical protein
MPFTKFKDYALDEGFCCPYAMLCARRKWLTSALAEDSGITLRAVRFWRKNFREGELKCAGNKSCLIRSPLEKTR